MANQVQTNNTIKIGISCNAPSHPGGTERYAVDLAQGLVQMGIAPVFFAPRFNTFAMATPLIQPYRLSTWFLPKALKAAWFSWRLQHARRAAKVDVLISCNRTNSSDIAICGGTHKGFLRAMKRKPKHHDLCKIARESKQYQQAAIIIAHSQQMRHELLELYGIAEAKIKVLYPPVDSSRFTAVAPNRRAELRRKYGFAEHEIVLLFPSNSHERKGLPFIETALRKLDLPIVLAMVGRPPSRTLPGIRHIGYVQKIEDCYRAADFTILASVYEPFGLAAVESVLCGTPVILPTSLGCCDAIANHAKFLFTLSDVNSLCVAIKNAAGSIATPAAQLKPEPLKTTAVDAVRYDPSISTHIDAILALAQRIHTKASA
jgi:glycosyltransferase involved in cell wall biosynthesis